MALMTLPQGRFDISRGDLLSFLCAVTFALHIVVVGHFSSIVGFETLAATQICTAALLGMGSFWFAEPVRVHFTPGVATAVLVTGLLATALAFATQAWAQQYTSSTRAALIFALEPVAAWVTSFLLYGERLAPRAMFGAVLILAGILTVELKRTKAESHHIDRAVTQDLGNASVR
jgi:drug/metabolite transporter (DMT)-like permease